MLLIVRDLDLLARVGNLELRGIDERADHVGLGRGVVGTRLELGGHGDGGARGDVLALGLDLQLVLGEDLELVDGSPLVRDGEGHGAGLGGVGREFAGVIGDRDINVVGGLVTRCLGGTGAT